MNILVFAFEIFGTIAFSISGVLVALEKKMDLLGVVIMGLVTAVGGGIIRDVLLGDTPPKAFLDPTFSVISIITSLTVFFFATRKRRGKHNERNRAILFLMDSIGLGVFTVVGIEASYSAYGFNLLLNIFMGTVTGVGGGVMRDMFSARVPMIFTKHFYATASIVGSLAYIALFYLFNSVVAGIAAMLLVVLLRIFASKYLWNLPKAD